MFFNVLIAMKKAFVLVDFLLQNDMKLIPFFLSVLLLLVHPVGAQTVTVGDVTKLPVPRFVSVRSDRVYARTGPGTRYPIQWIYQQKNLPVEIVQEFDTWRKIRDIDGQEGWVHQSLLSGKRFAMFKSTQAEPLLRTKAVDARPVALVEPRSLMEIRSCESGWCDLAASGYTGWMPVESLWGVYEGEQIE